MPRVHDLRGKERKHVVPHIVAQVVALLAREILLAQVANVLIGEERAHALVRFLVVGIQLVAAGVNGLELLGRRHTGFRIDDRFLQKRQVGKRTDTHHEELLEVAPENGDEIQPLEQRYRRIGALVEHAFVEIEPGKLAVLHIGRLHNSSRCGVLCCLCIHGPSLLPLYSRWPKKSSRAPEHARLMYFTILWTNARNLATGCQRPQGKGRRSTTSGYLDSENIPKAKRFMGFRDTELPSRAQNRTLILPPATCHAWMSPTFHSIDYRSGDSRISIVRTTVRSSHGR